MDKTLFTYTLTPEQGQALERATAGMGALRRVQAPYTALALKGPKLTVMLYTSGKLVVQGKEAQDFVLFTLEPLVLKQATLGYEETLDPTLYAPHMGTDESGKGDIFGPLVTCAAFIDETTGKALAELGVRDSKTIADGQIQKLAAQIRRLLGRQNVAFVLLRPPTYNRLYAKIPNVNRLLAWCHARAIESLAEQRPDCTRAVVDQFARTEATVARALMARGRKLKVEQMHKAERDIAVAQEAGLELPKGAGPAVPKTLRALIAQKGPGCLPAFAKCHFKTVHEALAATGHGDALPLPEEAD